MYVYILSNSSKNLYIGVTGNIETRMFKHKNKTYKGFTSKYNISKLVYVEMHNDQRNAIAREKQLKGWKRSKKIYLIEQTNPQWQDLMKVDPSTSLRMTVTDQNDSDRSK